MAIFRQFSEASTGRGASGASRLSTVSATIGESLRVKIAQEPGTNQSVVLLPGKKAALTLVFQLPKTLGNEQLNFNTGHAILPVPLVGSTSR